MLFSNGIDGATGTYFNPPMPLSALVQVVLGARAEGQGLADLRRARRERIAKWRRLADEFDPRALEEARWGVVFAESSPRPSCEIEEALKPLLDLRREQSGQSTVMLSKYRAGEDKGSFLARHDASPGPVCPQKLPYYILLIGSPEEIPFNFQYQLSVQHAVGRLHFDTLDQYEIYAKTVVAAERQRIERARQISLFGVENADDPATRLTARHLVSPLATALRRDRPSVAVDELIGEAASKQQLESILAQAKGPAILFAAAHGLAFEPEDPRRQKRLQGAILCQDWPGPIEWGKRPIPERFFVSGSDIDSECCVAGLVAFLFACHSCGTPCYSDFAHRSAESPSRVMAESAFISRLSQRLLSHSSGAALAVIGHVERAWPYSFLWPRATGPQIEVFRGAIERMLDGHRIGYALELFDERYAELATMLAELQSGYFLGRKTDPDQLVGIWTTTNDARNTFLLGDPAVKIACASAEG